MNRPKIHAQVTAAIADIFGHGDHTDLLSGRIMDIIAEVANQHAKDEYWRGYREGHLLANPRDVEL